MQLVMDLKVDNGDDIILRDDLVVDIDPFNAIMRTSERRISARYDDFTYTRGAAGLERFIQQKINTTTKANIEEAIRDALYADALMLPNEYDVFIVDVGKNKLQIIIQLRFPGYKGDPEVTTFKVMVNLQNQRSYK